MILIVGVGNIFLSDDGFGVEVIRRLQQTVLPENVSAMDFGIRAYHLAYQLLEPYTQVIFVDAVSRGEAPGTLYVIDGDEAAATATASGLHVGDAHGLDLNSLFEAVKSLGGKLENVRIVGCEPESLEEGMGLSDCVQRAIDGAVDLVYNLVTRSPMSLKGEKSWSVQETQS